VIESDSGVTPELVRDAELAPAEGGLEELAAALGRLTANPDLCLQLAARGPKRGNSEFTNYIITVRLAAFWVSIAGRRG
jgi:hypothetical protein